MQANGVYELRTYDVKPEHLVEYLNLTSKLYELRVKHSVMLGYWITEIGGQNQVVHLWWYPSIENRAQVRVNLANDANWMGSYMAKIRPWLVKQDNLLMNPVDIAITAKELEIPGAEAKYFYSLEYTKTLPSRDAFTVGTFQVTVGHQGQYVVLRRSKHPTDLLSTKKASFSKILLPVPWAPKFGAKL